MRAPVQLPGLVVASILSASAPSAQELETRADRVTFPAGQTGVTLRDTVTGSQALVSRLSARGGQAMTISLTSKSAAVHFNLCAPGRGPGNEALANSGLCGPLLASVDHLRAQLPATADDRISVCRVRAAARRSERASFALAVSITGGAAQLPGGGAIAGPGDPALWRVGGVGPGDSLKVRTGPPTAQAVLVSPAPGEIVRNLGCTATATGTVSCRVERPSAPGRPGWAAARYLAPAGSAAGGGTTQGPGTAPLPGPGVDARGGIDCGIGGRPRSCAFGVTRRGRGDATPTVAMPGRVDRRIDFAAGRPVSSNPPGRIWGEWSGDTVAEWTGPSGTYLVPNAAPFGG